MISMNKWTSEIMNKLNTLQYNYLKSNYDCNFSSVICTHLLLADSTYLQCLKLQIDTYPQVP